MILNKFNILLLYFKIYFFIINFIKNFIKLKNVSKKIKIFKSYKV